jgi:hypothetical protein
VPRVGAGHFILTRPAASVLVQRSEKNRTEVDLVDALGGQLEPDDLACERGGKPNPATTPADLIVVGNAAQFEGSGVLDIGELSAMSGRCNICIMDATK